MNRASARVALWLSWLVAFSAGCSSEAGPTTPVGPSPRVNDAVLVGAGDIAECGLPGAEATASLLDDIPGTVFTAGDNAYFTGSRDDFARCYEPTWGRHKSRTRPVPGNHEYETPGAAGYFGYFGSAASPATQGFYSYNLGAWHVVALNSQIAIDAGSAQLSWLRADLAANPTLCTLAYVHYPLFSSGLNGPIAQMRPLWDVLYAGGAEVVVSGHDHLYERFAPQNPAGGIDLGRGIRQFVAGTGGANLTATSVPRANSDIRASVWGVLKFTLRSHDYDWEFVPAGGRTFRDIGSGTCH